MAIRPAIKPDEKTWVYWWMLKLRDNKTFMLSEVCSEKDGNVV